MENIISLIKEPVFWFATVLMSIITGVAGNYGFKFLENLRIKYNENFRNKKSLEFQKMYEKAKDLSKSKEDLILESVEINTIYYEITIQFLWIFSGLALAGFLSLNFEKFNSFFFYSIIISVLHDVYKSLRLYRKLRYSKEILILTKILMNKSTKEIEKNMD